MNQRKQIIVSAFALFSLFFGAGNLILPPFLGYNAGESWLLVSLGFAISAVVIPILAIYGHARLQGTMLDFANKVSPWFALTYSVIVYAISISLPSPRTASVTHEMAIAPYFELDSLWTSAIYFALVLVFVLNRNRLLSIIGKYLTPLIIIILLLIIGLGLYSDLSATGQPIFENAFTAGILEGYQTFDAIGGVVVGGVVVISFMLQGKYNYKDTRMMIGKAGLIAGIGLFLIYGGLIALGAMNSDTLNPEGRTDLLMALSDSTLGNTGTSFLAVLVALACFTTAVGIVTGTSDFVQGLFKGSKSAYVATAVLGCIIGVGVGQFDVHYIIDIALPALMFIYPITIVLIFLSVMPKSLSNKTMYRIVVAATILFSVPDFLKQLISQEDLPQYFSLIPLADQNLGWVIPATLTLLIVRYIQSLHGRNWGSKSE